jgi:hypothetical protein
MMGEATANDWLKALRRNNEVDWRDRLVATLAELVRTVDVDGTGLRQELEQAGDDVVARKRSLFPDRYPADYRQKAVERLTDTFAEHAQGMDDARRAAFGHLVFLVNSVAGLDRKQKLNLHMIYADKGTVAGDRLASFGGFLSEAWRQHDYTIGRGRTRDALPWVLGLDAADLPDPEPGVPYEPATDLGDIELKDAPREAREHLRFAAMLKVEALTRHLPLGRRLANWAARKLIGRQLGL